MKQPEFPSSCRIGCVPYLNALPLVQGIPADQLSFAPPSALAEQLTVGRFDAALLPVFELFRHPELLAVEGVGIACDGPVYSVYLCHRSPLEMVSRMHLDPNSRSSNHLCQLLLSNRLSAPVEFDLSPPSDLVPGLNEATLIIGNPAIELRQKQNGALRFWDLGEAWKEWTGLPFVFAVWAIRPGFEEENALADSLRQCLRRGLKNLDEIVAALRPGDRGFARRYLTEFIKFEIGGPERSGLERFQSELIKAKIPHVSPAPVRWI